MRHDHGSCLLFDPGLTLSTDAGSPGVDNGPTQNDQQPEKKLITDESDSSSEGEKLPVDEHGRHADTGTADGGCARGEQSELGNDSDHTTTESAAAESNAGEIAGQRPEDGENAEVDRGPGAYGGGKSAE